MTLLAESKIENPFAPRNLVPANWKTRQATRLFTPFIDLVPGVRHCRNPFDLLPREIDPRLFAEATLSMLDIQVEVAGNTIMALPREGGAIIVANHPFGGLDGLVLIAQLRKLRPDVKFMANQLLECIPQLGDALITVDVFGSKESGRLNSIAMRRAIRWVQEGGMLVVFPAGEVSHLHVSQRAVVDPQWSTTVARMIRHCRAPVFPAHFSGRNSKAFQAVGLLHPLLRTALLPRELLSKRGSKVSLTFGTGIRPKRLNRFEEPQQLIDYLRLQTYLLGTRNNPSQRDDCLPTSMEEIAPAVEGRFLSLELSRIPVEQCLAQAGKMSVWHARAEQIPSLLMEIGRLREETFRGVGEGTGNALDIDCYDEHYQHPFLWNQETSEIVGAYRIGTSDTILESSGTRGFYTSELFQYHANFFSEIGPSLELGRSFVRESYQRNYTPLLLLWQGIGQFLVRNPRYRTLFGPVSISNDYSDMSRKIMASSLYESLMAPELQKLVRPRNPYPHEFLRLPGCTLASVRYLMMNIDDIDALIDDFEPEQKGIPVLLRHYLNLGGKIVAMNLDSDFQDALDALLVINLDEAPGKSLERYMGKSGLNEFMSARRKTSNG